jgi:hypothetical protein
MKITLKVKVVADISNAPKSDEPTLEHLAELIEDKLVIYELVWRSFDNEPTLVIRESDWMKDGGVINLEHKYFQNWLNENGWYRK